MMDSSVVVSFDRARIEHALADRARYKYVQPRVEPAGEEEGLGWKIVSPNCSRNIARDGGDIAIAWLVPVLVPDLQQRWAVHARDHQQGLWVLKAEALSLDDAMALICADPQREYWQ
jgi:hypothetical protein